MSRGTWSYLQVLTFRREYLKDRYLPLITLLAIHFLNNFQNNLKLALGGMFHTHEVRLFCVAQYPSHTYPYEFQQMNQSVRPVLRMPFQVPYVRQRKEFASDEFLIDLRNGTNFGPLSVLPENGFGHALVKPGWIRKSHE